ncbi:uncharacterized protein BO88DRAFT_426347 [Aspergillus vadensis CBS 113365]|uniref:Uncharacterized protein n=1 Tax=Aspergillus vadensis (strain CBS 113365 / IMI 142717 / IBT 24658) TaxID=1448311 RepID=A0A319B8M2_ASPVC|nr:hypothetical protein BO88DRAFT_426347 [Aspergillus vadensis CBS 113365]PYH68241.1 hypothetical protein BO88DRAFT_426347 [Aspergillus vadensis CBS 113365]
MASGLKARIGLAPDQAGVILESGVIKHRELPRSSISGRGMRREYQPGCGGEVGRIATAADPVNAAFPDGMKALKGVGIMEAGTKKIG